MDSAEGINVYNRLIGSIGGDSIKYNRQGYNMQGWNDDYYKNGKLLHRGYYVDGQVITFRNFFENGQCERLVMNPDPAHCIEQVYYDNGQPRREINYYNGKPQKRVEYYPNGQPRYAEENEKEMKYLTRRKSWYVNGSPENNLEVVDTRTRKYVQQIYYTNGQLKEEGPLFFNEREYVRDGTWASYDSDGKNKRVKKYSKDLPNPDSSQ